MSAKACVCKESSPEEIRSLWGEVLATMCRRCRLPLQMTCRVCKRTFRDLNAHLRASECGRFDKQGMWWTTERPPTARKEFA